jgi:hypothetical protein
VILAELGKEGVLFPGLEGKLIRAGEARRLGVAMLRDCIEKAIPCAGFDPLLAYFPPERRGEAEEAIGKRQVWAEPLAGPTAGGRAEGFLRHLLAERTYRRAVALFPAFPHIDRNAVFEAARGASETGFAYGASAGGAVGLIAAASTTPSGLAAALDGGHPAKSLAALASLSGNRPFALALPDPIETQDALAKAVFDLRAAWASRASAGDDLPLNLLEVFESLGLVAALKGDGSVEMRRAGPPQRRTR